jgi:GAF domain-containing protein
VLGVINSSPGDLAPVFDAMLERAGRLSKAAFGVLWRYDGEHFHAVATHGVSATFDESLRAPIRAERGAALDRIVQGELLAHVADVAVEDAYRGPAGRALAELGGARTVLGVPLRKEDDTLLGAFAMFRQEVRPFSDQQIALLQNFAAQAVIAMENARLITETREALEQQTATAEVLVVINSSPGDLAPVFDAILEKAHTLCGAAHGALVVYDGEHFRAMALRAIPEVFAEMLRQPFRPYAGGAQEGLLRGDPLVHIPDVTAREPTTPIQQAALDAGIRTLLMVPLRKDGRLLGYITAHRREVSPFTDKQIALLQNFAAQAVIAMENA